MTDQPSCITLHWRRGAVGAGGASATAEGGAAAGTARNEGGRRDDDGAKRNSYRIKETDQFTALLQQRFRRFR